NRQATRQDILGMLDFAAAGTGQVALVQRLKLQHQRVLFPPRQSLADDIRRDPEILAHRNGHWVPPVHVITDYSSMHYYKTVRSMHYYKTVRDPRLQPWA